MAVAFAAAMAATLLSSAGIRDAADDIIGNSSPSITHLAGMRTELRHFEIVLDDAVERRLLGRPWERDVDAVTRARAAMTRKWTAYLALPTFPGERELQPPAEEAFARVVAAADVALASPHASTAEAALERTKASADELDAALSRLRNFNADQQRRLGQHISAVWHQSFLAAVVAVVIVVVITVLTALSLARLVRRMAHAAEERAEELEAFAGRVAHDLVNPLTAAVMTLTVLREQQPHDAAMTRRLERLATMLGRAGALVQDLYEYAAAGGHGDVRARADVGEVVRDVVAVQQPSATRVDAELTVDQPLPAAVACRPGVLISIMTNLIDNALKHMGDAERKRVAVHVRDARDRVRIEVEDNGPGIAKDRLAAVFEPYTRGETNKPGLGLGLATVKRLTERHGGAVGVRSTVGSGSTFWLELPKATALELARR